MCAMVVVRLRDGLWWWDLTGRVIIRTWAEWREKQRNEANSWEKERSLRVVSTHPRLPVVKLFSAKDQHTHTSHRIEKEKEGKRCHDRQQKEGRYNGRIKKKRRIKEIPRCGGKRKKWGTTWQNEIFRMTKWRNVFLTRRRGRLRDGNVN